MSTLGEWWGETWGKVKHAPAILPTTVRIPAARTDEPPHERFRRDAHYFEVTVNRIFLKYDRELWKTYAPMALVVTEFQYDAKDLSSLSSSVRLCWNRTRSSCPIAASYSTTRASPACIRTRVAA